MRFVPSRAWRQCVPKLELGNEGILPPKNGGRGTLAGTRIAGRGARCAVRSTAMTAALNPRHAVYAGSFDPVTLGHADIVLRGARIYEHVTVAIGINPEKAPLFSPEERVALLQEVFRDVHNVSVACFEVAREPTTG